MSNVQSQYSRHDQFDETGAIRTKSASIYELDRVLERLAAEVKDLDLNSPLNFSFMWHDIPFAGQILTLKENRLHELNLVANIGHLTYSAEDIVRRRKMLEIFLPLVEKGEFTINRHSQIQLIAQTTFKGGMQAKNIMTAITFTLLDIQPKLQEIAHRFV
ncbi:hypothetical protein [Luteithermobacter gelatinilyticus]|uniref:hypothetical protein n=1 Tax=Luteithermobacter gelatinilyticus TaxID=2582913 RepID=UPI00110677C2|nr:hypothetical protein [Luteithermobacter gelatinilyticus]